MKNLLIISLVVILICQSIYGQNEKPFTKGYLIAGGTMSFYFERENDIKLGISPYPDATYKTNRNFFETDLAVGYFLIENFSFGLKNELIISNYKTTSKLTPNAIWDIHDRNILVGPFVRYYSEHGIFFEGYGGLGILSNITNGSPFKLRTYIWSTGIGYVLFLNKNVSIEPIVKYSFFHKKDSENMEDVSSMKLSFSVGFQIYLNVKRKDI